MFDYLGAEDVLCDKLDKYRAVSGGQAEALCPFHSEKNPSFRVNIDSSSEHYLKWECKSCLAKGFGKKLLLHLLGEENEAVIDGLLPKYLLQQSSLLNRAKRESHFLPEAVLELYRGWSLDGLLSAGFKEETLELYEVGYDQWKKAWTYPIRNQDGKLVGIYRRMPKGSAKYLPYGVKDYPEGLIEADYVFRKSDHLWGLNLEIQRTRDVNGPVVLVEGMKACMWVRQVLGDRVHAVASMGISLGYRQAELLSWLGKLVLVLYDNNPRAKRAARNAAELLRGNGVPARAIRIYAENVPQPDDLTPDQLEKTLWDF